MHSPREREVYKAITALINDWSVYEKQMQDAIKQNRHQLGDKDLEIRDLRGKNTQLEISKRKLEDQIIRTLYIGLVAGGVLGLAFGYMITL